jgi:hypothetical protein
MNDFKLDSTPKVTTGFNIPEDYFENFSERLMQQLPKEETKVISFWDKNRNWLYSTAAVFVVGFSIPMLYNSQNNSESISATEIENYIAYNSSVSDEEIAEILDTETTEIHKTETTSSEEDQAVEDVLINNPNLENYITN